VSQPSTGRPRVAEDLDASGSAVIFAVHHRPVQGTRGTTYRVSRLLRSGRQRRPRGVIFHGAEGRVGR
jgi:hypothetical protein